MYKRLATASAVVVFAMLAVAGAASAGPSTTPGGDVAYQVEISANLPGVQGGGIWLWLELDKNGQGIYDGSDCGRGGAVSDQGTLSWWPSGGQLVISGVQLNGLPPFAQGDVVVPSSYGHYQWSASQAFPGLQAFFTAIGVPPDAGFAQIQVAP